jgi:hypothetical protein
MASSTLESTDGDGGPGDRRSILPAGPARCCGHDARPGSSPSMITVTPRSGPDDGRKQGIAEAAEAACIHSVSRAAPGQLTQAERNYSPLRSVCCCLFTISRGGWLLRGVRGAAWSGPGLTSDPGSCFFQPKDHRSAHGGGSLRPLSVQPPTVMAAPPYPTRAAQGRRMGCRPSRGPGPR